MKTNHTHFKRMIFLTVFFLILSGCTTNSTPPQIGELEGPTENNDILQVTETVSIQETATAPSQPSSTPVISIRVIHSSINVRSGPGINYDPISYLYEDDIATVIDQNEDQSWYKIQTEDGTEGWVGATVVELIEVTAVIAETETETSIEETEASETFTSTPTPPLYVEVSNISEYLQSDGDLVILGEVTNLGEVPAKHIELTATLYDAAGLVLAHDSSYASTPMSYSAWYTGILFPGEKVGFDIFIEDPGEWNTWRITHTYDEAVYSNYNKHYMDLEVINDQGREVDNLLGNYQVAGEIKNIGVDETGPVRVVATLYNDQGKVVDVCWSNSEFDPLMPDQVTPFSILCYAKDRVDSYSLDMRSIKH